MIFVLNCKFSCECLEMFKMINCCKLGFKCFLVCRYNVTIRVYSSPGSVSSDVCTVVVQRAVRLNRLLHTRSVLLNTSVPFSCRVSAGTDVTYLWDFGDGTQRTGQDTEYHVFNR